MVNRLFISLSLLLVSVAVSAEDHIVEVITDNELGVVSFSPKHIKIKAGDTVTWVNKMDDLHNIITYPDGYPQGASGFSSPYLETAGETWSYTFNEKGTFQYHCIPHIFMGMRGTVVVDEATPEGGFNKPTMAEVAAYRDELLAFFDAEDLGYMPNRVTDSMKH